jgi:hypothetical protein
VNDAEHPIADEQRRSEQRLDALFPKDRIEHVGVVDVRNEDDIARCRHASRESLPERDAGAALDLFLQAFGGSCNELVVVGVEHQQGRRVGVERVANTLEQLVEELVERKMR